MILATHALVGAAIGKTVSDPLLIILASIPIHFFLDTFRHGEYFDSRIATVKDTAWKVTLDLGIGGIIIATYFVIAGPPLHSIFNMLLGAFFSILPDLLNLLYWKFHSKLLEKIKSFHSYCHRYARFPQFSPERQWTLRNAANDIIFSLLAITLIFFS
jgi:hypothetical protein